MLSRQRLGWIMPCSVALVLVSLITASCKRPSPDASADPAAIARDRKLHRLPGCPRMAPETSGWSTVRTGDGLLMFQLPPGYSDFLAGTVTRMWDIPGGTFAYSTDSGARHGWSDEILTDSTAASRGWCLGAIAGREALMQYGYAPLAHSGSGYYLQAVRPLEAGRELHLIGYVRDTTRARSLLEIAWSVRVLNEPAPAGTEPR